MLTCQTKPETMETLMMKPDECARLAGCSTRTIVRMCNSGVAPWGCARFGSSWRINRRDFMRAIGAEA